MTKILAIDDIRSNLTLIESILAKYIPNCEVLTTLSAKEGIEIAKLEQPDTILLDIHMPHMNGFEACKILKADIETSHIPIIIISAIVNDSDSVVKGLNYGAVAFISKPISARELSAQVKVALRIKQAEDNLKKETDRYRIMTHTLPDAVTTILLDGEILYASPRAVELFGFDNESELIGTNVLDAIVPEHRNKATQALAIVLRENIIKDIRIRCVRKNGSEFNGEISASVIMNDLEEPSEIIIVTKDITNRETNENKIINYQKKLKSLNFQMTSIEEKERRKIAINLHDSLGQELSIAHIKMSSLSKIKFSPKVDKIIKESTKLIRSAIKESRSLTNELSPPILFESGLIPALKWRLEQVEEKFDISTAFSCKIKEIDIDNESSILLYRIICELLMNIIKHANSSLIKIEIRKDQKHLYFEINDNGCGFEYHLNTTITKHGGFGLFTINERIESIQGEFVIDSELGKGTTATVITPL